MSTASNSINAANAAISSPLRRAGPRSDAVSKEEENSSSTIYALQGSSREFQAKVNAFFLLPSLQLAVCDGIARPSDRLRGRRPRSLNSILLIPIHHPTNCAEQPEFVARLDRFARQQRVPVVQFRKGERKDDVAAEYLKKFKGEEGVLFIGKAQEKSRVFRTERRRNSKTGATYPWLTRSTAMVNNFYIYCVDRIPR